MTDDAQHLGSAARLRHARDIVGREVDLLVVVVKVLAGGVGDAGHRAQDQRHGARRWDAVRGQAAVEVGEHGGDGFFECGGGGEEGEEGLCAGL